MTMTFRSRTAAAVAAAAALSLSAAPAMARGWHGHHHRDRVDAGDVFAGLLVVGGIAAIAAAASKSSRERQARADDRYRDYPAPDARAAPPAEPYAPDYYDDARRRMGYESGAGDRDGRDGWRAGGGMDAAVDACAAEAERSRGIEGIDSVSREGEGWRVYGRTAGGAGFSCSVDATGRVRGLSGL